MDLDKIREAAERVARSLGLEIFDVEWKVGKQRLLRVYIDRLPGPANPERLGISHKDCERVSEQLSVILDVEDMVPGPAYMLEVSSPGLDRKLIKPADYERFAGRLAQDMAERAGGESELFRRAAGGLRGRRGEVEGEGTRNRRAVRRRFARRIWWWNSKGEGAGRNAMASLLFQTIEQISREKHIEPEIIVAAIEDAMVVAARKYYRTEEDLRSKFNPGDRQVDVFSVHTVVEEVADPTREISLADARKQNPRIEVGGEDLAHEAYRRARPNRGADGQAGDPAEGARGRARHDLQRVSHARRRAGEQRREAHWKGRT